MEKENKTSQSYYYFVGFTDFNDGGEECDEQICYVGPFCSRDAVLSRFPHLKNPIDPIKISKTTEDGPRKVSELKDGVIAGKPNESSFVFPPECDYKDVMAALAIMTDKSHTQ